MGSTAQASWQRAREGAHSILDEAERALRVVALLVVDELLGRRERRRERRREGRQDLALDAGGANLEAILAILTGEARVGHRALGARVSRQMAHMSAGASGPSHIVVGQARQ